MPASLPTYTEAIKGTTWERAEAPNACTSSICLDRVADIKSIIFGRHSHTNAKGTFIIVDENLVSDAADLTNACLKAEDEFLFVVRLNWSKTAGREQQNWAQKDEVKHIAGHIAAWGPNVLLGQPIAILAMGEDVAWRVQNDFGLWESLKVWAVVVKLLSA